jgi:hypothetical protein
VDIKQWKAFWMLQARFTTDAQLSFLTFYTQLLLNLQVKEPAAYLQNFNLCKYSSVFCHGFPVYVVVSTGNHGSMNA